MKRLLICGLLIFAASCAIAQKNEKDSTAVRAVVQQYEDAWNKNDMAALCNLFTDDGSWINIGGLYWKNMTEVRTAHNAFAQYLKFMVPAKFLVQNIQIIAPGIALAFLREETHMNHDLSFPDGRKVLTGDVIHDQMSWVLVKRSGRWQIRTGHNTAVDPTSEKINPAKGGK